MYFRRIKESLSPTYFATNSTGNFVAAIKKLNEKDEKSWQVATGPDRNQVVRGQGLTMEAAFELAEQIEVVG